MSSAAVSFSGFDRFEVRGRLGHGAMGTVYRVHDSEMGREVALKTIQRPGPDDVLRLKREFRSRAGTIHPNLIQLHDLFVGEEFCFFTMELIDGSDLVGWGRRDLGLDSQKEGIDTDLFGSTLDSIVSSSSLLDPLLRTDTPIITAPPGAAGDAPPVSFERLVVAPDTAWERLRDGLAQLIRALDALHASGRIHRDVKPANVLVASGDRVILLDFGLVTELEQETEERGHGRGIVGTPAYMAPEQVLQQPVTPATDLYAVGVILYQLLTGVLPFAGAIGALLDNKVRFMPRPVRAVAPRAPRDLADLAMELLATLPAGRPTAEQCIARLTRRRDDRIAVDSPAVAQAPVARRPFVGRADELAALSLALDVAAAGRQATVHIHGPSGIGKSTLVREFLAIEKNHRDPLVLQGRCHPQESVPYKALDAAVDALAQFLDTLPAAALEAVVPTAAYALLRLFPVLGKFAAFLRAPAPALLPEAIELRQHGFRALRDLLSRLSEQRQVVLWLDDLQWGDIDSAPLLDELVRSPAPPFLLVLTYRSDERERSALLRHLLHGEGAETARDTGIALGALGPEQVAELARSFFDPANPGIEERLQAVVAHADGNPFIAGEVARYLGSRIASDPGLELADLDAGKVVLERVQSLEADHRSLMEIAAIAGGPVDRDMALAAAGLGGRARPVVAWLRDASLLREISAEGAMAISTYHDRIREALLDSMSAESRKTRHLGLAEALTAHGSSDFEALLFHWEGGGAPRRAGDYAVRAADRAAAALAFDRAATLYEKSLVLLGADADRPVLLEKLGDVLAGRGRAPEAARRYLEAATALGSGAFRRVNDLRRRAAEQYIKSGRIDDGWREMRGVLQALNIPIPGSVLGAVGAATWRRVAFLLHRLDVEHKTFTPAPPDEQYRMEVLWSASTGWAMINHTLADVFRVMHLLWAVKSGDIATLCRSLAYESAMEVHVGGSFFDGNAQKLLEKVEYLVKRTGDPYDRAWLDLARANDGYTHGKWRETADACARADEVFRERCPGSAWERVTVAIFHHHALAMLGDLPTLRRRLSDFHQDATLRGDIYAICEAHVNEPVLAWLADDKAEEARAIASQALAAQTARASSWPENAYRRQHFADLVAITYAGAYRGDPWPAWKAVLDQWAPLKSAFLLPLRVTGLGIRHARARAALAAAATLRDRRATPPSGIDRRWTRDALLDDVREQSRIIGKDSVGCAEPTAALLRAAVAHQVGKAADARKELRRAVDGFAREEMALYREAARYTLGERTGGSEGASLIRQAEEWMSSQGVVKPRALVAAMVPGAGITGG